MKAGNGSTAVMARRTEAADSLDDFPTPPWATRALFDVVLPTLGIDLAGRAIWEPACNRGLTARVIGEHVRTVHASDVHDYGFAGASVGSFVGEGVDVAPTPAHLNIGAVITNPPFNLAEAFVARALEIAPVCALLLRLSWIEGVGRFKTIFEPRPPAAVGVFCERVAMVKGGWRPDASTAAAYAWFVWEPSVGGQTVHQGQTRVIWIPPGTRRRLMKPMDIPMAADLGALMTGAPGAGRDGCQHDFLETTV